MSVSTINDGVMSRVIDGSASKPTTTRYRAKRHCRAEEVYRIPGYCWVAAHDGPRVEKGRAVVALP
jgi:hypothetical protein